MSTITDLCTELLTNIATFLPQKVVLTARECCRRLCSGMKYESHRTLRICNDTHFCYLLDLIASDISLVTATSKQISTSSKDRPFFRMRTRTLIVDQRISAALCERVISLRSHQGEALLPMASGVKFGTEYIKHFGDLPTKAYIDQQVEFILSLVRPTAICVDNRSIPQYGDDGFHLFLDSFLSACDIATLSVTTHAGSNLKGWWSTVRVPPQRFIHLSMDSIKTRWGPESLESIIRISAAWLIGLYATETGSTSAIPHTTVVLDGAKEEEANKLMTSIDSQLQDTLQEGSLTLKAGSSADCVVCSRELF